MTLELCDAPALHYEQPESSHSEILYQIGEQLRYAEAIWDMLEAGTWNAAVGAELDSLLGTLDAEAGQVGWSALSRTLTEARRELRTCVQHDCAPDPESAATLHSHLAGMLVAGQSLRERAV